MRGAVLGGLVGLCASLALVVAWVGPPRLYGLGCTGQPLGLALLQEEDEIPGPCTVVAPLPLIGGGR